MVFGESRQINIKYENKNKLDVHESVLLLSVSASSIDKLKKTDEKSIGC